MKRHLPPLAAPGGDVPSPAAVDIWSLPDGVSTEAPPVVERKASFFSSRFFLLAPSEDTPRHKLSQGPSTLETKGGVDRREPKRQS